MKKNFFKQLACVLSLAMVVTSVAPASTAVEAAKASSLNAKAKTIAVGGKFDIDVKNQVKGTKYSYDYLYTAGKNYVTLNKKTGVVTGKKAGKATIKCTAKKGKVTKILKCVITVAPKATKVTINNAEGNTTIKVGTKFNFNDTVTPSNASKSTWSISDSSVFKVDKNNGYVRALKPGKATLTVTNGSVSDKIDIVAAADYSATQAGAKTIKVTSPVMLKDTDIKVNKGSATVAIADKGVKLSDDKLTAEITMAGRLVDGTYSVTLNADKKLEFTAATEKVSKIELLSDKAALAATTSSKATVGYKVTNQFAEDITKRTSVQISGSHGANGDGKGTINFEKGGNNVFNQNVDIVSVVIIHTETGITAQATLTVSAAKAMSEVAIVDGIYNEDGKKLDGDSDLNKDDFYLLVDAKDQYGNNMTEVKLGTETFVTVAGGLTKLTVTSPDKTKVITKDGKDYMGVKLTSTESTLNIDPGTATVTVIGAGNGKQASGTITVADGIEAVTLNVFPSDTVLAGNTNDFTFEATDAYGNAVTKYSVLKKAVPSTTNMKWEEDYSTGNAKLKYTATSTTVDTPVVVTFQLTNYKIVQSSFTVKGRALPKTVTKVDKDLNVMSDGVAETTTIDAEHLLMENQYGSQISFDNMRDSGYTVKITPKDAENANIKLLDANGAEVVDNTSSVSFAFVPKTNTVPGTEKTTDIFKIQTEATATVTTSELSRTFVVSLMDNSTTPVPVSGSEFDLVVKVVPQGKLTGYAVEDVKPIYVTSKASKEYSVGDGFARELKVTAKRSGTTVVLGKDQYNIIGTDDIKADGTVGKIYSAQNTEFKDGITEIKQTIKVIINATGDTIEVPVVLKNEAPKVVSVAKDNDVVNITTLDKTVLFDATNSFGFKVKTQYDNGEAKVNGGKVYYALNSTANTANDGTGDVKDLTPRITFTDYKAGTTDKTIPTSAKNGTADATITLASTETVMVTLDFGNGQIIKFKAANAATLN